MAAEKVIFAALRALVAALLMIPVGIAILGSIPWRWGGLPLFAAGLLLGALVGAGFGLLLGTLVQPQRINLLFSLVFTPLRFTGCSQYPWPSLARLRWCQVITAGNPMTYVSEALRGALVPQVPRIRPESALSSSSPQSSCSWLSACAVSIAGRSIRNRRRIVAAFQLARRVTRAAPGG